MKFGKLRGAIGLIIMILALIGIYFWLSYGQLIFNNTDVVVAVKDIQPGTIIENVNDYFARMSVDKDLVITGGLGPKEINTIVGLAAKHYIPRLSQINEDFFMEAAFIVSGDNKVFKLPSSWVYAIPSTIRRGDKAYFYEIRKDISEQVKKENSTDASAEMDLNVLGDTEISEISIALENPVFVTTVLYVKDGQNREVIDSDANPRLNGTSQVSSIEVLATEKDIALLEGCIKNGMQFIILYGE